MFEPDKSIMIKIAVEMPLVYEVPDELHVVTMHGSVPKVKLGFICGPYQNFNCSTACLHCTIIWNGNKITPLGRSGIGGRS